MTIIVSVCQRTWLSLEGKGDFNNSLCCKLPFGRRVSRDSRVRLPRKENVWNRHQHLFEENVRKTKGGPMILRIKGSGVFFTHGEGISTLQVHHKGRQPLIKCAKSWLQFYFIFPFYVFIFFGVNKSGAFAPTYSQLRWGTQTYIVL